MLGTDQRRQSAIAVQWGWLTRAQADACLTAGASISTELDSSARVAELLAEDQWRKAAQSLFDRYLVLRQLGVGATARAYLVTDRTFDRQVVLKVLRGDRAVPQIEQRFKLEIKALARLSHPNVVRIFDGGGVAGRMFLTMEYVPGVTLRELLDGKQRPSTQVLVTQLGALADAVAHVHERGIIHRDLKPANVLVSQDGGPKLLDFGLVRHIEDLSMTGEHALIGTPLYMAPEQLPPRRVVPQTDVYQLGAMLYEILSGHPPFKDHPAASNIVELTRLIRDELPTPPPADVAPGLADLAMRALAKRPGDRPSAAALARGLSLGRLDAESEPATVTRGVLEVLVRHPRTAGEERHSFPLAEGEPFTIGRVDCTFRPTVRDRRLSRHHCTVRLSAGELHVENHSSNGTVVDGAQITDGVPVGSQALLGLGELQIALRFVPLLPAAQGGNLVGCEHNGYVFEAMLSDEGGAPVYRATRRAIGRTVAVKTWPDATLDDTGRTRIRRAVRLSKELGHPGFVQVLDAGQFDGLHFMVTEYLDAPTVAEVLECGPLSESAAVQLVLGLGRAVAHAHRRGIVHRAIRPENVYYDGDGVKLGGLGYIRSTAPDSIDATVGVGVGQDGYTAPEQLAGGTPSPAADVYSLGALLSRCVGEQGPALTTIVRRCLDKDPARRGTAVELVDALERLRAPLAPNPWGGRGLSQYRALLPATPAIEQLELATLYVPGANLGGDFYDFVPLADGRLAIVIGEVSGDGLAAGLVVGMLKISLRHQLRLHDSPARVLCAVNDELRPFLGTGSFAQVLVGLFDPRSRTFCFAGGGCAVAPLLASGVMVEPLEVEGTAIGLVDGGSSFFRQDERDLVLATGDTLLFLTDGALVDARADCHGLDLPELAGWLVQRRALPVQALLEQLAETVRGVRNGTSDDDMTAIAARVR